MAVGPTHGGDFNHDLSHVKYWYERNLMEIDKWMGGWMDR